MTEKWEKSGRGLVKKIHQVFLGKGSLSFQQAQCEEQITGFPATADVTEEVRQCDEGEFTYAVGSSAGRTLPLPTTADLMAGRSVRRGTSTTGLPEAYNG